MNRLGNDDAAATAAVTSAPRLIGLLGAECSGKSTLARELAAVLGAELVVEELRSFVDRHARPPLAVEQRQVAASQIEAESRAILRARGYGSGWVVCDPCPLMTAVYSMVYFDDPELLLPAVAHQRRYAITFLCDPDIPWVAEAGQRDGPQYRQQTQAILDDVVDREGIEVVRLGGSLSARLQAALAAVALVPKR